jgi:hypothetical protein
VPVVENEQLTRLHETYVWYVNAAVGEGRFDLVQKLADEYLDEALALITADESAGCDRPDCIACRLPQTPHHPAPAPLSTGWRRWLRLRSSR